jgi:hypothetical protein
MSMQDLSAIAGTVGALARVVLGGWLAARSQRALLKESQRQSGIQARESAYAEFLVAYRRFRRFLIHEQVQVRLVERPGGEKAAPLIEGASNHWEVLTVPEPGLNSWPATGYRVTHGGECIVL